MLETRTLKVFGVGIIYVLSGLLLGGLCSSEVDKQFLLLVYVGKDEIRK